MVSHRGRDRDRMVWIRMDSRGIMAQVRPVVSAYRELLRLIRRLPEAERKEKMSLASETMRKHRNETNAQKVSDLHKELVARISWLRVVTPRKHGDSQRIGAGRFVLRDGKLVEGQGDTKGARVADGKVSMNEAWEIHNRLLKRQYFGRDPPKTKGLF